MSSIWKNTIAALLVISLLPSATAEPYATPQDIPAEIFAKLPDISSPKLSPSGDFLASSLPNEGREMLVLQGFSEEGKKQQKKPIIIPFDDLHLHAFEWVNDDYLVAAVRITRDNHAGHDKFRYVIRSMRIQRKTGEIDEIESTWNNKGTVLTYSYIIDLLPNEPDHVLMALEPTKQKPGFAIRGPGWTTATERISSQVHKVNIRTGSKEIYDRNPRAFNWAFFDSKGIARIGLHYSKESYKNVTLFHQSQDEDGWFPLEQLEYFNHQRMFPHFIADEDDNILVVSSRALEDENYDQNDDDLYAYDLTKKEIVGPYKHPIKHKLESAISKAVGSEYKVDIISSSKDNKKHIFYVYSDQYVPGYYFFDLAVKQLIPIASTRRDVEHLDFSTMDFFHYSARDGLEIPAYLTMPKNTRDQLPPLVVYPHGGPFARDYWGFDNMSQFLASRGYAVLQPQFRGSRGFGVELEEAGYQQWGYAMQDDITDGIKHLIKEKKIDSERVCIMGASYGGYATGMGLVKTPDLYNCGISINGVMDLVELRYDIGGHINERMINSKRDSKNVSPIHLSLIHI